MQRYFITNEEKNNSCLIGEKYHHIANVMRMAINDEIELVLDKKVYLAKITEIKKDAVSYQIVDQYYYDTEFAFNVTILQGYPKGDKMDDIIKHSTELGVYSIIPVIMERSVVRIEESKRKAKQERLQKIALEASRQSKRNHVPIIENITSLMNVDYSLYNVKILAYEEEASNDNNYFYNLVKELKPHDNVLIAIGPEGGFSSKEADFLIDNGFVSCSLGKRILRTETASLYVLSAIGFKHL